MPSRIQRELALLLTGKDVSWSKTVNQADRSMAKLHRAGAKAGANMARNLERGVVVAGAAGVAATAAAVNAAMDFESSSASVRKTVDGNVDAILRANRELAKTTGLEVNALNEISATAGALGIANKDIDDFTKTVAILGVTTDDVSTDAAAESIGHLSTTLKMSGPDLTRFGNDLVHLGNNGASTEGQILSMAENIAGAADVMDASTPQVLGWAAALANTGEEAEAGGSSIQRFWLESFKNVQKGGKELKLMAKITGQSAGEFKKAFGRDATGTLAKFITKLGKLSKAEQVAALEALGFTDIRITRALLKLLANTDNLTESLENSEQGWKDNRAATDEARKRFETTANKLAILRANVNDAAITIGSKLLPVLAELSEDAVKWIDEHQGDIEQFGDDLAAGVREAVRWAQKLDWEAIGKGFETAAGAGKGLVEAFTSAPPWLQGFLTTGFLANKFTGGAVMDVAGILLSQAVKGVLGMNAGVVNIRAGVVNGAGGLPGGGAAGGGGGNGGTLLKALGVITVIGTGVVLSAESIQGFKEQNDQLRGQGLNAEEIAAMHYYTRSTAEQETIRKRLGYVPDKAYFNSGIAKLDASAVAAREQARTAAGEEHRRGERLIRTEAQTKAAVDASKARLAAAQNETRRETTRGLVATAAASRNTTAAVKAKRLSVNVRTAVNVRNVITARDIRNGFVIQETARSYG